jgi:GNAT superfamily N-acetyltransferase
MDSTISFRETVSGDLPLLQRIHLASRQLFIDVGRLDVTRLPVIDQALLENPSCRGLVAIADSQPVGFGVYVTLGSDAYLDQLSVSPEHTGRGVGGRLLDRLIDQAKSRNHDVMTLITYDDLPWNGPFYRKHGFTALTAEMLPTYLADYLDRERRLGMDMSSRVAMRCYLSGAP